jgi:hypothetical protein
MVHDPLWRLQCVHREPETSERAVDVIPSASSATEDDDGSSSDAAVRVVELAQVEVNEGAALVARA